MVLYWSWRSGLCITRDKDSKKVKKIKKHRVKGEDEEQMVQKRGHGAGRKRWKRRWKGRRRWKKRWKRRWRETGRAGRDGMEQERGKVEEQRRNVLVALVMVGVVVVEEEEEEEEEEEVVE
jgi:hypothetical protein